LGISIPQKFAQPKRPRFTKNLYMDNRQMAKASSLLRV